MSLTISLTPDQVEHRLAAMGITCRFTSGERAAFATMPVVESPVRIFGFPTPADNTALTIAHIKSCVGVDPRKQPSFFDHPWYQDEKFLQTKCTAGWHFLMMDVMPDSIQKTVHYLRSSGQHSLELPGAIEIILMLFLHFVGSGEQLLLKKHTWCSDSASFGRHVTVGAFGRNGVFLSGHPSNFVSQGLGVCAKILTSQSVLSG